MRAPAFKQIVAASNDVYGLDAHGRVWVYQVYVNGEGEAVRGWLQLPHKEITISEFTNA